MPSTPTPSMKLLLQREIIKRIKDFTPGEQVRRSRLKRDILQTSDIAPDLVRRLTCDGKRILSSSLLLRRIDRILSDALSEIDGIFIHHDEETRASWIVRDDIGSVRIRNKVRMRK